MTATRSTEGEVHAVIAIDPGGTTGVFAMHVCLHPMLKGTLQEGLVSSKGMEVHGDYLDQAAQLAQTIVQFMFVAQVEHQLPAERCHITFENYTRRPGASSTDLTSVWVAAATMAMLPPAHADMVTWQEPSQAKTFASNQRLKLWGMWQVGSEHVRDACRHACLRVSKIIR